MMLDEEEKSGSRLLVTLIDKYANADPSRIWASFPTDEKNLSLGFQDITYRRLANAINHAASWLQNHLPPATAPFETVAYTGPQDARYPIFAVAIAKIGRKILFLSPQTTSHAQAHLLNASACKVFLHAASFEPYVKGTLSGIMGASILPLQVPKLSDLLHEETAPHLPYTKTWEEAKSDPWMVFHTSGTTGLPKLITYTHQMMASLDAEVLMPDSQEEITSKDFRNRRWYTAISPLHLVGMTVILQFTVYLDAIIIFGPVRAGMASPQIHQDTIRYGKVQGAMLPPALIDSLCNDPVGLEVLHNLDYLYFAGAPLTRRTAEKLIGHVAVKPAMGSTEAGAYFTRNRGVDDWEYYTFRPSMGVDFRHATGDLYEAVFIRNPEIERWQQIFCVYPDLAEFPTKDLFSKHPTKTDCWKYVGRTDDVVVFSNGYLLYVAEIEAEIGLNPAVSGLLVGGQGRPGPFLLIEWRNNESDDGEQARLDQLWSTVDHANRHCSDSFKITREFVLFATPTKRLIRTAKGTVARRENEKLYAEEIDLLYKQ